MHSSDLYFTQGPLTMTVGLFKLLVKQQDMRTCSEWFGVSGIFSGCIFPCTRCQSWNYQTVSVQEWHTLDRTF